MRFSDVETRLSGLPPRLPKPPPELMPVLVPGPDGAPPAVPSLPRGRAREAAVLVLIHPNDRGEACVVLTERAAGGHRHAGQVSFPGGAIDEDDVSIVAAALREASEEVGLDAIAAGVRVVGVLAPVDVRVSGFLVHQVIALTDRAPALVADGYEVAAVVSAPLATFLPSAPIEMVAEDRDGLRLRYGAYRVGDLLVWGATAGMLGRLGAFLANAT